MFIDFPREQVVLAPLLYTDIEEISLEQLNPEALTTPTGIMATSLAEKVREIGYGLTSRYVNMLCQIQRLT
jgi:hypothetical protein